VTLPLLAASLLPTRQIPVVRSTSSFAALPGAASGDARIHKYDDVIAVRNIFDPEVIVGQSGRQTCQHTRNTEEARSSENA